jgi:hypothetical protein
MELAWQSQNCFELLSTIQSAYGLCQPQGIAPGCPVRWMFDSCRDGYHIYIITNRLLFNRRGTPMSMYNRKKMGNGDKLQGKPET